MLRFFFSTLCFISLINLQVNAHAALFQKDKTNYFAESHLPTQSLVPGGIALIPFQYTSNNLPTVTFQDNRVMVLNVAPKKWIAVVGLSLSLTPGEYNIELVRKKRVEKLSFKIDDKEYEAQYITLKNTKQVNPSQASLERIGEESAAMKAAFKLWNEQAPTALTMDYPVQGPLSSQFGLKRFFNNEARNPHSGLDIAANRGSPIQSPLAGTVSVMGNYYFNGNTVLIDHGQGMVSMYCHLDAIQVEQGQTLSAGDIIGSVGSTGRATGPHLHWSINLNNARVDPLLFLKKQSN